ncbi:hypothetical protein ACRE_046020 [Hapsidospora chrysogenum ATCC 11550]|uniref:Uncharacterized protein n=1 Tax=Hapsidospora chrysogenum (strain ATCC 11550 / CBS 779.69 / DSM 880 / IAM 14645 / JCM 23072 / IMI 49137) TaxID=857340 RepID=A0A086T5K7_HAPC1|nr:hypothetical protein ACRE_046020 [Hapsidospora chrysogenum ATCC 11550]
MLVLPTGTGEQPVSNQSPGKSPRDSKPWEADRPYGCGVADGCLRFLACTSVSRDRPQMPDTGSEVLALKGSKLEARATMPDGQKCNEWMVTVAWRTSLSRWE